MAGMNGVDGNVSMSGAIGGVVRVWSANFTRVLSDITGFGNAFNNRTPGIFDITGSMSGVMDDTLAPTLAFTGNTAAAALTLTAQTGNTIVFPALFSDITISSDKKADAPFSANFAIASTATTFDGAGGCIVTWS